MTPTGGEPAVDAQAVVDEKGLPAGTGELADPAPNTDNSETTTGTFNISTGGDTLQKLEIADKDGNLVDVTSGGTVQGHNGDLTVTLNGGVYSYSYTLANNVTNADPTKTGAADQATGENFAVTVTDSDGDHASASLTVNVNDDGPHAINDSATQATENAPVTIDVFANDIGGADGTQSSTVTLVAGSLTGGTGTLVNNGNGTFTYTPAAGEDAPVSFKYTITDGDGDKSEATATITLVTDSTPTITVTPTGGEPAVDAQAVVDEKGLPAGTGELADPAPNTDNSETTTGTFNISTGGDTLQKLEIADKDGNLVDVTSGGTVQGHNGDLTVTLNGGVYSYSYTLANNVTNADPTKTGAADQAIGENFAVTVTDSDGDQASASLTVNVNDDGPSIVASGTSVSLTVDETTLATNATASFAGAFTPNFGADGPLD
ncbi:hypothetical protein EN852_016055, partial [Mesorhizobium sp. M2E.F.Ca.ET.209.01.1.1]